MTEQEIKTRIEKKEKDIQKIEKKIAKWTTGMSDEAKQIVAKCEITYEDPKWDSVTKEWKEFDKTHKNDPTVYRQDYEWNKGPSFDEARRAYIELAEAKATLNKYQTQLNKVENFNNMEKIPAIWDFLQDWRKQAYEYFVENVKLYAKLRAEESAKWKEYEESEEGKLRIERYGKRNSYYIHREWLQTYYGEIHGITRDIYLYNGKWDDEKLNKILDKDVQNKYTDFVHRITEKAGVIQDASQLRVAGNGAINGIVVGDKNKVRVETITAGGYNIQILHYRVLVHIIK